MPDETVQSFIDTFMTAADEAAARAALGIAATNQIARLGSDFVTTSTSLADVTGMTATLAAGKTYKVEVFGSHMTSGTSEGLLVSLNGSAAAANIIFEAGAATSTTQIQNIFSGTAYDEISPAFGAGPGATARPFYVSGVIKNGGSSSTLALRARAETGGANSATVVAGTVMVVTLLD
jgi:hypothetical protein